MKRYSICSVLFLLCSIALIGGNRVKAGEKSLSGFSELLNNYYEALENDAVATEGELSVDDLSLAGADKLLPVYNGLTTVANVKDFVNIRAAASAEAEIVGRLYKGGLATFIEDKGDWTRIQSGSIEGYISSSYLLFEEKAATYVEDFYKNYIIIESDTLNVRTGPGTEYELITTLTEGKALKVLETSGDWYKVELSGIKTSATSGYVHSDYVTQDYRYAMSIEDAKALDIQNSYNINNIIWPLPSDHRIGSYYGPRRAPTAGASTFHKGLDIGGSRGSSIVAALSGTVVTASYDSKSGNYVAIDHGNGFVTKYLHASKLLVSVGQTVMQGDTIALVGSTGVSTSPHLHFSIYLYGNSVDPYPYLKYVQ